MASSMEKYHTSKNYTAILIAIILLVLAGGCVTDTTSSQTTVMPIAIPSAPAVNPALPASPAVPPSVSTHDSLFECNPDSRVLVPVDTSVPIWDPMPGVRYSINESESGRTLVFEKGDIIEINLRWIPGQPFRWIIPVSGCGLELMNDGTYDTGTDFWNASGHYRARYRAISRGTSIIDGKFVVFPNEEGHFRFNLIVIVK